MSTGIICSLYLSDNGEDYNFSQQRLFQDSHLPIFHYLQFGEVLPLVV